MGRSGKPDVAYRFDDHARTSTPGSIDLDGVVLVGHDWRAGLRLETRHPAPTRGVAFMETILRPMTWDDFPGPPKPRVESLRTPGVGEPKVLDENFFIEWRCGRRC